MRGCKDTRGQSWSSEKISANSVDPGPVGLNRADQQIFFPNSNFDLQYLCSPLTEINI